MRPPSPRGAAGRRAAAPRPRPSRRLTLRLDQETYERLARLATVDGMRKRVPLYLRGLIGRALADEEIRRGLLFVEVPELVREMVRRRGSELVLAMAGLR